MFAGSIIAHELTHRSLADIRNALCAHISAALGRACDANRIVQSPWLCMVNQTCSSAGTALLTQDVLGCGASTWRFKQAAPNRVLPCREIHARQPIASGLAGLGQIEYVDCDEDLVDEAVDEGRCIGPGPARISDPVDAPALDRHEIDLPGFLWTLYVVDHHACSPVTRLLRGPALRHLLPARSSFQQSRRGLTPSGAGLTVPAPFPLNGGCSVKPNRGRSAQCSAHKRA